MRERVEIRVRGAVQGVGFRPFVYRLARELALDGSVANDGRGVRIDVEGEREALDRLVERLRSEAPAAARIESLRCARRAPRLRDAGGLEPRDRRGFHIEPSPAGGPLAAELVADIATCSDCLRELADPADRRAGYPFVNCTHCGPRFSIVHSLPYDRERTTMRRFDMCAACRAEYEDPLDRRFHAQPNACPACGPELELWKPDGGVAARGADALRAAAEALRSGEVLAVKGLGGFHLMVDARDGSAIGRLRARKPRGEKPFALMARDLEQAAELCVLDGPACEVLASPEAPILLLPRREGASAHRDVAPGNPTLGVMLASTPLHHLLLRETGFPLVATSGNLRDEPICTDEGEALHRLEGIADALLVHDRPIARHVDDSVAWRVRGETRLLRRARGFAPRPVSLDADLPTILAVGAHLKCTIALSVERQVFLSQHIGDMETPQALEAFERVIDDFLRMYEAHPAVVAHDLHPDYVSTRFAEEALARGLAPRLHAVQHHHAHLAACLAENRFGGRALGVTWDGTGRGTDGTIWGGELLLGDASGVRRVAHLRPLRLPGGEAAIREPRRSALAALYALHGPAALERDDLAAVRSFDPDERALLGRMLERGVRAPLATSAGRLFDAVAALAGPWLRASFEAQAAMALEFAADPGEGAAYPLDLVETGCEEPAFTLDWGPTLEAVLDDTGRGVSLGVVSARFHNALAEGIARAARAVGEPVVALSGGCFQNRLLLERSASRLERAGLRVLLHRHVPPGDGGISLGQVAVAAAQTAGEARG